MSSFIFLSILFYFVAQVSEEAVFLLMLIHETALYTEVSTQLYGIYAARWLWRGKLPQKMR